MLQRCAVEKDVRGQPRPWSGAFAVVFKATDTQGLNPFAVRVFTTESPERRERYDHISAYLNRRRLNCLCAFEYRDSGIRSAGDGKWYPLILMEWVQGDTLFQWARARSREGNTRAFAEAAERWLGVAQDLEDAAVAHGDLQHANIMVDERGQLKLVDYDCLCVPALVGRRNQELGVEPYQHPARNGSTLLSLDLDHFSELVIYTALRALAAAPDLWQRHVEATGYDKLLFRSADLRNPASSALCRELQGVHDTGVRQLVDCLCDLARSPMDRIPSLSQMASSCAKSVNGGNGNKGGRVTGSSSARNVLHRPDIEPVKHPLPHPGSVGIDAKTESPAIGGTVCPPTIPGPVWNGAASGARTTPPPLHSADVKSGSRPVPPPLHTGRLKSGSRPAPPPLDSVKAKSGSRSAPPPRLPWIDANISARDAGRPSMSDLREPRTLPAFFEGVFSCVSRPEVAWACLGIGISGFVILLAVLFAWRW